MYSENHKINNLISTWLYASQVSQPFLELQLLKSAPRKKDNNSTVTNRCFMG